LEISFDLQKNFLLHYTNMSSVKLPDNIDYTKYTSNSGMSTKYFGQKWWDGLFISILGRYPTKIDTKNSEHIIIKNSFKNMLIGLQIVIPCIYCRNSFKKFLLDLPIEPYLIGRIELMYWLYLIKDKVNNKLICQEKKCYTDEKLKLKTLFYSGGITEDEYYTQIKTFKEDTFNTIPTPPFETVLDKYESLRAVCSDKAKTCTLPKK
jgi:hypothetical protein